MLVELNSTGWSYEPAVLVELNSAGLYKEPVVKLKNTAGLYEPTVIADPYHCRYGCAGSKSDSYVIF